MLKKKIVLLLVSFILAAVFAILFAEQKGILFLAKFTILSSVVIPVVWIVIGMLVGIKKRKVFLANFALLGITIAISLVVAELTVRFLYKDITTTGDYSSYFTHRWISQYPPVQNRLGFREREIMMQKPDDVFRIIVIGDSYTYGQGVLDDARFTHIIERDLNNSTKNSKTYEVLNFGKPGAATADHISFLEPVSALGPDFILLQWLPNDVEGRNISDRPQPYRLIPSDYLSGWLHRNSALFFLVKTGWYMLQTRLGVTESYRGSMMERFVDPESEESLRANRELNEFIHHVKEEGIPVGIVMFPFLGEGDSVETFPYSFLIERVIDTCRREAIQCLDLRPILAKIPPSKRMLHQFDAHPSPLTNEVAAKAILDVFSSSW